MTQALKTKDGGLVLVSQVTALVLVTTQLRDSDGSYLNTPVDPVEAAAQLIWGVEAYTASGHHFTLDVDSEVYTIKEDALANLAKVQNVLSWTIQTYA